VNKLRINAIYLATEGEGLLIGRVQIFVRFQGCLLGCKNCDSKDTWNVSNGSFMSEDEVIAAIEAKWPSPNVPIKTVSITGGDPLNLQNIEAVRSLVVRLKASGYTLSLEAAGDVIDQDIFQRLDFINFDFKTPSSGVQSDLEKIIFMQQNFTGKFQVKSVVEDKNDFDYIWQNYQKFLARLFKIDFIWVITPAYNLKEKFPLTRFVEIINWNQIAGGPFRVIGQQHKWIFGPDKKLV